MNSKLKSKFSILLLVFFPWCRGIGLPAPLPQNLQPPDRTSLPLERVLAEDQDSFVSEEDFSREGRGYETDLLLPLEEEEGYWAGNENLRSQPMPKGEEGGGVPEELRSGINCQGGNDQVSHIDCLTLLALQATRRRRNGSDELSSRTDDANVMPGVKDVQERGFKWGFGSKKSRKGKKKRPGTVIRRAKKWKKRNRKGNKVVRRKPSSSFQNRRAAAQKKRNRGQKKAEKEEEEEEKKKDGETNSEISGDDQELASNPRDNWKKWDQGALDSGQADDMPGIQDDQGEFLQDERNDGEDTESLRTDNDNPRDSWDYDESSSGNVGESFNTEDSPANVQGNGEVNNEVPATVSATASNPRDDWKKWDRGAKDSGKTGEKPEFQGDQKGAWKKWDNERETDGNIQKPPDSQSSVRDGWKKWVH